MREGHVETSEEASARAFRRGVEALAAGRFPTARRLLTEATASGDGVAPWAAAELVQAFLRGGDVAEAEPHLRATLPDPSALLGFALGTLWRRLGRLSEAREALERAARSRPKVWAANNELGWLRFYSGDVKDGLRLLRSASRHFERTGDVWGLASATTHRATAALTRFRLREAQELFEKAAELKGRCGERLGLATTLYGRAQVRSHCADFAGAREGYEAARDAYASLGHLPGVVASWNGIAATWLEIEDGVRAERALRRARRVLERAGAASDPRHAAALRLNEAEAALVGGRPARAARVLGSSLDEALDAQAHAELVATTASSLMEALLRCGRPAEVAGVQRRLPPRVVDRASARARVALERRVAHAVLAVGDAEEAYRIATGAARRLAATTGPASRLSGDRLAVEATRVHALLELGQHARARRRAARLEADLDALISTRRVASSRVGLLETLHAAADACVAARLSLKRGAAVEAWRAASRFNARELLLQVSARSVAEEGDAPTRLDEVEAELRELAASGVATAATRRRWRELRALHDRLCDEASRRDPAARGALRSLDAALVQAALGPRAALIDFHVTDREIHAFVVHGGTVQARRVAAGRRRVEARVRRLLAPLHAAGSSRDPESELASFDPRLARRIARELLGPVLPAVAEGVDRLVVVPDGALHAVPFELLLRQVIPKADHVVVSHALAAELLEPVTRARRMRVVAVGHSPPPGTAWHDEAGPHEVAPIPGAHAEARAVARVHAGAGLLVGRDATPEAVLQAARGADVLHVAAHGIADPRSPGLSGLVLADPRRGRSGFLSAARIARERLSCRLVVLSGCETARGRFRHREGVVSLARAFVQAGARAVIATQWAVPDRSSLKLARQLHRELAAGAEPARALASARAALRADAATAHAFHWAPFVLFDHALPGSAGSA